MHQYSSTCCQGGRSPPDQLLDGISPEQSPELTLEVLGLVKWPRDMGDHCTGCELKIVPTVESLGDNFDWRTL